LIPLNEPSLSLGSLLLSGARVQCECIWCARLSLSWIFLPGGVQTDHWNSPGGWRRNHKANLLVSG